MGIFTKVERIIAVALPTLMTIVVVSGSYYLLKRKNAPGDR